MKRALAFVLLMAGSPLDAGEIVQKPLDEFVIYNIPVACQSGNTTVLFPSAISGLYAKSVAVQEQPKADFVLSFTPGNFYFTVRALKKDAEDHLTVIYNRKAYVLYLSASEKPFYSVTFFQGGNTRAATRPVVPERLLSLLDKAKAYPLFQKDWTELFQKPAGRLVLFLLVGGIFLAFILMRRGPQPKPDNTPVASQATQAKSYSFEEDIQPLSRSQATPSPREADGIARATPTPKPPPPIPQTIFATREQSVSEWFLPYGRLLRCELVNTVDSTNIDTPIIGLLIEDIWNV
jgi:hypothetical protein